MRDPITRYLSRAAQAIEKEMGPLAPGGSYSLAGLPQPAWAVLIAAWYQKIPTTVVVVVPDNQTQETLAIDLEAWGVPPRRFPEWEKAGTNDALPDPDLLAQALYTAWLTLENPRTILLVSSQALQARLPAPKELQDASLVLEPGKTTGRDLLLGKLEASGYHREIEVEGRGQYAVRGCITDVFSWTQSLPVRCEWDGETLLSLREFDPVTQSSIRQLERASVCLWNPSDPSALGEATLFEYLPKTTLFLYGDLRIEGPVLHGSFYTHDFLHGPRGDWILEEKRRELLFFHLRQWVRDQWEILIFCNSEGEKQRLSQILAEENIQGSKAIQFFCRPMTRGFAWREGKLAVLTDNEIFGRYERAITRAIRARKSWDLLRGRVQTADWMDWEEGTLVVHAHHGIARFRGLHPMPDGRGEALLLEFAQGARLYVPLSHCHLVTRYVGPGKRKPPLDVLGGPRWGRALAAASKAAMEYAAKLLRIQAERQTLPGYAFPPDDAWQKTFEDAFLYEETPDQLRAIEETKRDMESPKCMDRLICGDVGFGKTEVAIRAIFKAVLAGKQAAFLCPTTVLARQHYRTLQERFADYPISVALLSRFQSPSEEKKILQGLACGNLDVVVGTHRLLSPDVRFRDLGLVVIDEEQRFGVRQKESFKEIFRRVDVLSLSATPIPRTLYLALAGVRDMSLLETPPPNRKPVETIIAPYDERLIRTAIERELARGGQVYFLHNRIGTLPQLRERLALLVPKASVEIIHGRMPKRTIEDVMQRFVDGKIDILLTTSIIENGLDIPNANTVLIDRADRFGLADLYQIRGRVGRAGEKAYAYLLLPKGFFISQDARKRVSAMEQYKELGSGFQIALRDLEIRGAGSLLGTDQSGHLSAVGFDLYCRLLQQAIQQLKGKKQPVLAECKIHLDFLGNGSFASVSATIPPSYLPDPRVRVAAYRALAQAESLAELDELLSSWRDRYGPLPQEVELLAGLARLRLQGAQKGLESIETVGDKLLLRRHGEPILLGHRLPRICSHNPMERIKEIEKWVETLS
ncbi:transcription-repair coupling factor [Candidatus Methylacidithermus pantelleriae]|uniref:Transcription-repair-coupling factor n=1 Tax=Candidatus Methylacidithermus pantelleriae TaxID=2744239 RepID=A0A8J2FMU1_9BACT|nr:transcription-repair coupling factor [Candidatus Methylacidithermus pantelleriae]CAF0689807.1 Transcription-repair-coupling factor [Candidatus Methylacidithermus pantelleriae]